jgi:hypothetical protein
MDSPEDLRAVLAQFVGPTANLWTNASWPWLKYSDGVQAFAEHAGKGAYWLIDRIGRQAQQAAQVVHELHISVAVDRAGVARITATDGKTSAPQIRPLRVLGTGCPEGTWQFVLDNGGRCVLRLPTEV